MTAGGGTRRRRAARVAVLDASSRVLLLRAGDPFAPDRPGWWELPGGGIDAGEDSAAAAARELWEEAGLEGVALSPPVWAHHVEFDFAGYHFDQHEVFHLAFLGEPGGEIRPAALEGLEAVAFSGARWVPVPDLGGLAAGERVIPGWLPERLPEVLRCGLPAEVVDLGDQGGG